MFTLLQATRTLRHTSRLFSFARDVLLENTPLKSICELPRIKQAMTQENIHFGSLKTVNKYYLNQFEVQEPKNGYSLYNAWQDGHISFAEYAFAGKERQDKVIWFLKCCENAREMLDKKHVKLGWLLNRPDFQHGIDYQTFHRKFVDHMLDTGIIKIAEYLEQGKMSELYRVSKLLSGQGIDYLLKKDYLTPDWILKLNPEQLAVLIKLSSVSSTLLERFMESGNVRFEQFFTLARVDSEQYINYMHASEYSLNNFSLDHFLSLKPSTRERLNVYQYRNWKTYMSLEQFDALDPDLQLSLSNYLFTETGLYALSEKYITVEKFCSLSEEARDCLCFGFLFRNVSPDYNDDSLAYAEVDRVFTSSEFDLEEFDRVAKQSNAAGFEYLTKADETGTQQSFPSGRGYKK